MKMAVNPNQRVLQKERRNKFQCITVLTEVDKIHHHDMYIVV